MLRSILCCGFLMISCLAVGAQAPVIPLVTTAPVVDGQGSDAVWQKVAPLSLVHRIGGGEVQAETTVRLCITEEMLYILFLCDEPAPDRMQSVVRERDGQVWLDDCVEIFLASDPDEPGCYYHIVFNSLGTVRDEYWSDGKDDLTWDSGVRAVARLESSCWAVEAALPFRALNRAPAFRSRWKAGFARSRPTAPELTAWQPLQSGFHEPERFGEVVLTGASMLPSVRLTALKTVERQAAHLLKKLAALRREIPEEPHSPLWQQAASVLAGWESRIAQDPDPARQWRNIRKVQKEMQAWPSWMTQARSADKRDRIAGQFGQPYAVFVVSPMTKLRPEEVPDGPPARQVSLSAARGEGESTQIVVSTLSQPLRQVGVTADLTGPGGYRITPEIHLVGYVPVKKPTPGGFGLTGRYPDPLLPLKEFEVKAEESQALWLTAWVPCDAPAGEYNGTIAISPGNSPETRIPFSLRVYDVTLPAQSALKTAVLIWNEGGSRHIYGDVWTEEWTQRFYETGLRYRFTAPPPLPWDKVFSKQADGSLTADWEDLDWKAESWMEKGATAFSIGGILRWGVDLPPEEAREETTARLRLLGEHLRQKNWSDRFYFYVFDELPPGEMQKIQRLCAFVHQYASNLRILLTGFHPAFRDLAGSIGIWVPHINQFDDAFMGERQAQGDQIWMYVCIGTVGTSYPDMWRIDWTGTAHRAVGWWLWHYNCEGFLYWCVDYWLDSEGKPFDLFAKPMAFPGGNGDGFLFYPDPDKKEPPFPSIRAEIMRDGFEDYDLLFLLREAAARAGKASRLQRRAGQLLNASGIIVAPDRFSQDPTLYEQRHQAVLEVLEQLR